MLLRFLKILFTFFFIFIEFLLGVFTVLFIYIMLVSRIPEPEVKALSIPERTKVDQNYYRIGANWIKKNPYGIWEMYIEGDAYERGLIYGKLAKELIQLQEVHFVNQINDFVPSETWQHVLRLMIGFFNKDIPKHISLENQQEIYGISRAFSDKYDYIAPKYARILNYHAAHDIGHALNDYSLVGCTSFALKGEKTYNSSLLVGRNFDFYVGDEFAEEKLILFVKPDKGYAFTSYSWAGFTGVASGMNETGLTVTINAAKSDLPTSSKTPISLLAREILQYAATSEEAIRIAKKRDTFVSETIMITSKKDGKMILIEKSPTKTGVFYPKGNQLICSNHYQSDVFKNDPVNQSNIKNSDSPYRYNRVQELLLHKTGLRVNDVVQILRDQYGNQGDSIGMGNPRALNQLLGHHSVVFQPEQLICWFSTKPYQLGKYIAYPLHSIFRHKAVSVVHKSIEADEFLASTHYQDFEFYRKIKKKIIAFKNFNRTLSLTPDEISRFVSSNSYNYLTYEYLGDYFFKKKDLQSAVRYYRMALTKELASPQVKDEITSKIKSCHL